MNECLTNNGGCAPVSSGGVCTNTPGSRTCACGTGYAGNGFTCAANGESCSAPIDLSASVTANGTTIGAANDFAGPLPAICGGDLLPGADVVYRFTPTSTGTWRVVTTTSSWSPRVWVSPTCGV
ncbi:MAG: hypothetical protein JNJ54_16190, partial [Myxococcaceae bacterium]|nr:hypothetical protein [Myxococcaceae bacterium]